MRWGDSEALENEAQKNESGAAGDRAGSFHTWSHHRPLQNNHSNRFLVKKSPLFGPGSLTSWIKPPPKAARYACTTAYVIWHRHPAFSLSTSLVSHTVETLTPGLSEVLLAPSFR